MTTAPESLLADDFVADRRGLVDPARARQVAPRLTPQGGTIYMNTADRDGLLVSLIQSNFFGAGCGLRVDEWGINLHNRGSGFNLDDGHPNAFGAEKMPLHTLIPGLALRDGTALARVRQRRGPRPGADAPPGAHAHARRRRRSAGRDHRAAVHGRPRDGSRRDARTASTPAWIEELRRRGHDIDVVPVHRHGPGIAHAIECRNPGYRAGSDPRAEGGVSGI